MVCCKPCFFLRKNLFFLGKKDVGVLTDRVHLGARSMERLNDNDESAKWAEEVDMDELIEDAREYDDFNMQMDEELAMYMDSETMEDAKDGGRAVEQSSVNVVPTVVCGSEQKSRKKECPGRKRRVVTVTPWDASARRQTDDTAIRSQLGQRGVT